MTDEKGPVPAPEEQGAGLVSSVSPLGARIYRHQAPLFLAKTYLGLVGDLTWDPNRASPIGDSPRELVSLAGLVTPCQSTQVVLSTVWIVHLHCVQMRLLQPFHRFEDCCETIRFAHFRRGEVCVTSGAIPITHCDFWLGIERDTNSEHLSDTVENVPIWYSHCPGVTSAFDANSHREEETPVHTCWLHLVIQSVAHYQYIVSSRKRIRKHGDWSQVAIRVVTLGLSCRRSIVIPDRVLGNVLWLHVERTGLGTKLFSGSIDPNVCRLTLGWMGWKTHEVIDGGLSKWETGLVVEV
ncbi:hypothetical protein GCK72_008729 [Caenorhabditis remanei]|uniref:Uncharacterized protein n=1 Tax=Caenorhabditis remanei TaxID=31234 RepID=A0A6A5GYC1_CAERE|nr:hypothetical protein GCK72_008729 [Caenorhabditis remanei]KAF1760480.1 hypothetical protein GCK72_008729 [Caenorhabditis remanei]